MRNVQKNDNVTFKEAFENQSQIVEEKVNDRISQLRNEITSLKSDLKKSQNLEEKWNCNISHLGNELITLKSEFENIVSGLTTINT